MPSFLGVGAGGAGLSPTGVGGGGGGPSPLGVVKGEKGVVPLLPGRVEGCSSGAVKAPPWPGAVVIGSERPLGVREVSKPLPTRRTLLLMARRNLCSTPRLHGKDMAA